jgi:hypothetical protein
MKRFQTRGAITAAVLVCLAAACGPMERHTEIRRLTRSIDLDRQEGVHVDLKMGAGELRLSGGTAKLMDADIRYRGREPEIRYEKGGIRGMLTIRSRHDYSLRGIVPGGEEWDIRLNQDTEMDLSIHLGAGKSDLRLGKLNLRYLTVNLGAGQVLLDLRGSPRRNMHVRVNGGVGEAVVRLPKEVGLRVEATGGLGSIHVDGLKKRGSHYENDLFERAKRTIDVSVHGGVGSIRVTAE